MESFEANVVERFGRDEDEVLVVQELNKVRQTGDMTVRDLAYVIDRFRFKLRDHPESYFV